MHKKVLNIIFSDSENLASHLTDMGLGISSWPREHPSVNRKSLYRARQYLVNINLIPGLCNNITGPDQVYVREVLKIQKMSARLHELAPSSVASSHNLANVFWTTLYTYSLLMIISHYYPLSAVMVIGGGGCGPLFRGFSTLLTNVRHLFAQFRTN